MTCRRVIARAVLVWAFLLGFPFVGAQTPSPVAPLLEKIQPASDDWPVEAAQDRASIRLKEIEGLIKQGSASPAAFDDFCTRESTATSLRPTTPKTTAIEGGTRIARGLPDVTAPRTSVKDALASWSRPVAGFHPRLKFKVIGTSSKDGSVLETKLRVELTHEAPDEVVQETSRWRVLWSWPRDPAAPLLIRELQLESWEQVSRSSPLLPECTAAVLRPALTPELEFGGDTWYGRIDGVGETNLLGQQGVAVGDVNGDGLPDLYVPMGTGLPNKLLVQNVDGSVTDRAMEAGVAWLDDTKSALFADMDNDGDQDLLCAVGPVIVLAKNDGRGTFERYVSMRAPTHAAFYSLAVADFDLDGDLDIYGCRYVKLTYGVSVPLPFHDANNGPTNHLLRNDGDDRYVDVTQDVGLAENNTRFSLACSWIDYDLDGDPDLYVANDFGRNNLYRNDGGTFKDVAKDAGVEDQAAGMGVSFGDYDQDGDPDLYVTNMFSAAGHRIAYQERFQADASAAERAAVQRISLGNSLFQNQGDGTFKDVSDDAGVRMGRWGWGAKFCDLNNDGFDDIVAPNGFLTGRRPDDL